MISCISIENFKGIGQRLDLDLKPLTLLFGANSAGKSTILHALHYAREVFERHNLNADQTVAGGPFVDLGGFHNFVHKQNLDTPVKISFDLDLEETGLSDYGMLPGLPAVQHLRTQEMGHRSPSYNGLVIAWRELTKLAVAELSKTAPKQSEMF